MIETWEKHIIYVTLHDKKVTEWYKEKYPDSPECWDSPIDINIEEIYRLEKTDSCNAVIWIPRDDQGGGGYIEVLENYDELYDVITSKSEYVKRRIGNKIQ